MPPVTNRLGYARRQRPPLNSGRERAYIGSKGEGFDSDPSSLPANGPASIACLEYDDNFASVRPSPCLAAVIATSRRIGILWQAHDASFSEISRCESALFVRVMICCARNCPRLKQGCRSFRANLSEIEKSGRDLPVESEMLVPCARELLDDFDERDQRCLLEIGAIFSTRGP
jgi:hypothetical protein